MKTFLFFISKARNCFSEQLEGIYRYARDLNWHVQIIERNQSRARVKEALSFWKPAGVFVEYAAGTDCLNRRVFGAVPVVYIDIGERKPTCGHYVSFDSAAAGRMGAEHLLQFGFRQYAYVGYWERRIWDRERGAAFAESIRRSGSSCRMFNCADDREIVKRHRSMEEWLVALPRPCGIMAANDRVAEEVLNACARLGISVPDEMAVLGVDNDRQLCENLRPTLTSIVPGVVREGSRAAELMDGLLASGKSGTGREVIRIPPERIVIRQSTRRFTCNREKVAKAVEMIRKRACEGIGVGDVAESMGVSRRMAERHFIAVTGHSVLEEITRVRLERVRELLANPHCALGSIAGQTGYSTEVALRKAFRLREGCSMRTWRERHLS